MRDAIVAGLTTLAYLVAREILSEWPSAWRPIQPPDVHLTSRRPPVELIGYSDAPA